MFSILAKKGMWTSEFFRLGTRKLKSKHNSVFMSETSTSGTVMSTTDLHTTVDWTATLQLEELYLFYVLIFPKDRHTPMVNESAD